MDGERGGCDLSSIELLRANLLKEQDALDKCYATEDQLNDELERLESEMYALSA